MLADFLIYNIAEALTCAGPAPRRGAAQHDAGAIAQAAVASKDGVIVFAGPEREWRARALTPDARTLTRARRVVPGLVDRTRTSFAGDRREMRRSLARAQIAAQGGGIVASVHATRRRPRISWRRTRRRLNRCSAAGRRREAKADTD